MTQTPDEREFYNSTGPQQTQAIPGLSGNGPPLHHEARQAAIDATDDATTMPANERPPVEMPLINGWVLAYRDATLSGKVVWLPYLRRDGQTWSSISGAEAEMLRALAGRILELEAKLDFTERLLKGSHAANLALTESWDQAETRSRELERALRAVNEDMEKYRSTVAWGIFRPSTHQKLAKLHPTGGGQEAS